MPKLFADDHIIITSTHLSTKGAHYALRDVLSVGFEAKHRPQFLFTLSIIGVNAGFFGMCLTPYMVVQVLLFALFIGSMVVMAQVSRREPLFVMTVTDAMGKHEVLASTNEDYLRKVINVTRRGIKYEKQSDAAENTARRGYATA